MKVVGGLWDPVQRGAHHLVESGVQPKRGTQSQPLRPKAGHTSQGKWGLKGDKREVEGGVGQAFSFVSCAGEKKRELGQEKQREQLKQRGQVQGQVWAASRGHSGLQTEAISGQQQAERSRPSSGRNFLSEEGCLQAVTDQGYSESVQAVPVGSYSQQKFTGKICKSFPVLLCCCNILLNAQ
jgi:hypothetical protein